MSHKPRVAQSRIEVVDYNPRLLIRQESSELAEDVELEKLRLFVPGRAASVSNPGSSTP